MTIERSSFRLFKAFVGSRNKTWGVVEIMLPMFVAGCYVRSSCWQVLDSGSVQAARGAAPEFICCPSARPNAFLFAAASPRHATPFGKMPGKQVWALWLLMPAPKLFRFTGKP